MRAGLFFALCSSLAVAQTADRTLVSTASRTVTLVADQATLRVAVSAAMDLPQVQALESLAGLGITANDLVSVSTSNPARRVILPGPGPVPVLPSMLQYEFETTLPGERLKDTLDRLEALRRNLPRGIREVSYSMVAGASERALEQLRQRLLPELLEEARKRAETLARAAGVRLGAIRSVNDATPLTPVQVVASFTGVVIGLPAQPSNLRLTYPVTVQFSIQ